MSVEFGCYKLLCYAKLEVVRYERTVKQSEK
jgi:hypothetical protein